MTAKEVASELNVSVYQVNQWKKAGLPKEKNGRLDPSTVRAWLISKGLADDPEAAETPRKKFDDGPSEVIARTRAEAARALGINTRTLAGYLTDPTFPGEAGDPGLQNGRFPIEKIQAWIDLKDELRLAKSGERTAAIQSDPTKKALDALKLEKEQIKIAELRGEFMEASIVLGEMQNLHSMAKQAMYRLPEMLASILPADMDIRVKENYKERATVVVEKACIALAEGIEKLADATE